MYGCEWAAKGIISFGNADSLNASGRPPASNDAAQQTFHANCPSELIYNRKKYCYELMLDAKF
jgi:hypothetical protein